MNRITSIGHGRTFHFIIQLEPRASCILATVNCLIHLVLDVPCDPRDYSPFLLSRQFCGKYISSQNRVRCRHKRADKMMNSKSRIQKAYDKHVQNLNIKNNVI